MELNKTNHSTTLNTITNTIILDGRKSSKEIYQELGSGIRYLLEKNIIPFLAVILVGERPDSMTYVKMKKRRCEKYGIGCKIYKYPVEVENEELIELIQELNLDGRINGILVQLPLPKHISEQKILDTIHPDKDADGFHPLNVGKLSVSSTNDENLLIPCTPYGCLLMLKTLNTDLIGKNAVVIGRSNIVGKPMAQLLLKESCTVTIAHSKTKNLSEICRSADILIAAVGKPEIVRGDWIKNKAIVIDVGINRIEYENNGDKKTRLVGDVLFDEAELKADAITPVPGGVGPMTIACLLRNTTAAFKNNLK